MELTAFAVCLAISLINAGVLKSGFAAIRDFNDPSKSSDQKERARHRAKACRPKIHFWTFLSVSSWVGFLAYF